MVILNSKAGACQSGFIEWRWGGLPCWTLCWPSYWIHHFSNIKEGPAGWRLTVSMEPRFWQVFLLLHGFQWSQHKKRTVLQLLNDGELQGKPCQDSAAVTPKTTTFHSSLCFVFLKHLFRVGFSLKQCFCSFSESFLFLSVLLSPDLDNAGTGESIDFN